MKYIYMYKIYIYMYKNRITLKLKWMKNIKYKLIQDINYQVLNKQYN